ncbi:MAG: DNA-binding protein [Candidatus Micrarchaeota archaeon]
MASDEEVGGGDEAQRDAQNKRYEEIQRQREQEMQLKGMLRQILDGPGYERLQNIRLTNTELYFKVAQLLVTLFQQGKLRDKVDERMLKSLLAKLSAGKRETKISFHRK